MLSSLKKIVCQVRVKDFSNSGLVREMQQASVRVVILTLRKILVLNVVLCSSCVFNQKTRRLRFTLDWFESEITSKFEVKVRGRRRPGPAYFFRPVRILNIVVDRSQGGLCSEADQRHAEIFVNDLGLDQHKVRCEVPGERLV